METFDDNTRKELDLNPRQFYIILREDNEQYHKLYKEIAEASENDEIRFCIIDTTILDNPILEKKTDLYKKLMSKDGEGNTWDFIIRDYPTNGKFSFSCWHRVSDDENDIKKNLNSWRNDKERVMWEKITRTFCGYFAKNTSTKSKIRAFYDTIDKILQSKGIPSARHEKERDKLGCKLESYNGDKSIKLVKNFVGENMSKIDAFFNVKSREKSDEYMRFFFETGGYIFRPNLKIINKGPVFGGNVHDKYGLQVTTTSGRTEEVCFSSAVAFSMYIFYMLNPYKKIKKDDFNPISDPKTAKCNWEILLTIYATIGENLKGQPSIERIKELYKDFFTESKKIWQNSHKDKEAFKELGAEAEPFRIHPTEDNIKKPERWLELSEYYIDLDDSSFYKDFKTNLRIIENSNLYQTFEKERNENKIQSVH